MKKVILKLTVWLILGNSIPGISFAQSASHQQLPGNIEETNENQTEEKFLETLKQLGVGGREGIKFFKDLKNKLAYLKEDEDSFLDGLSGEKPTTVSKKLGDGRIALAISFNPMQFAINSIFLSVDGKTKFIGTTLNDAHYQTFEPKFFEGPSRVLVFVSNQTNSGTGVASYDYDIYQVTGEKLISLGRIPLEGFENEWHNYLTIDYKSEFKVMKLDSKDILQVTVKYKYGIDVFQFTNTGGCITDDTPEKEFFLFDDELTFNYDLQYFPSGNEETETIFEKDCAAATTELRNSVFVRNHFEKLRVLAKNGKKSQKCWLRELLKDTEVAEMDDQHYRKELLAILNGNN